MARKHAFFLVVLLAAAALAGFVALLRTIDLAQATKATPTAPLTQSALDARLRELDRLEAELREQLAAEPPARGSTPATLVSRAADDDEDDDDDAFEDEESEDDDD